MACSTIEVPVYVVSKYKGTWIVEGPDREVVINRYYKRDLINLIREQFTKHRIFLLIVKTDKGKVHYREVITNEPQ